MSHERACRGDSSCKENFNGNLPATPTESLGDLQTLKIKSGAGEGIRTLDINLGKVALYQLSYARMTDRIKFLKNSGPAVNPLFRRLGMLSARDACLKSVSWIFGL